MTSGVDVGGAAVMDVRVPGDASVMVGKETVTDAAVGEGVLTSAPTTTGCATNAVMMTAPRQQPSSEPAPRAIAIWAYVRLLGVTEDNYNTSKNK